MHVLATGLFAEGHALLGRGAVVHTRAHSCHGARGHFSKPHECNMRAWLHVIILHACTHARTHACACIHACTRAPLSLIDQKNQLRWYAMEHGIDVSDIVSHRMRHGHALRLRHVACAAGMH
eukprot:364391-Chlamydomonas_euryale.AAC.1